MKLGISSCLLGHMCRYNGGHSKDDYIVNVLQTYFEVVAYCPESIIFGTPRDAIRLVINDDSSIQAVVSSTNEDVTAPLVQVSKECAQKIQEDNLCGFILKAKSPTCGLERVKLYSKQNALGQKTGVGLFAHAIKEQYPHLPLEEEGRLQDPWLRENFLMQIFAYKHLFEFLQSDPEFNDLVEFHTSYKYLIYAKSTQTYKDLGRIVANHEKKSLASVLQEYEAIFLTSIGLKGSIKKTYNVLQHIFGYFKKHINKEEKKEILEAIDEYKAQIIPLIAVIKIINLYAKRFELQYLLNQKFLNPYPKELALRSNVKAYK